MLTHGRIWNAIDRLAERYGLSASGLARRAGLDATSFNRSKRISPDGRERWPSTESIAKVLSATGASLQEFVALVEPEGTVRRDTLALVTWKDAGASERFAADGMPKAGEWDEIEFPEPGPDKIFALEMAGNAFEPLYRDGDLLIVSPTAGTRKGDRVVVRLAQGDVIAMELLRRTVRSTELRALTASREDRHFGNEEISWMARIMWVRQ